MKLYGKSFCQRKTSFVYFCYIISRQNFQNGQVSVIDSLHRLSFRITTAIQTNFALFSAHSSTKHRGCQTQQRIFIQLRSRSPKKKIVEEQDQSILAISKTLSRINRGILVKPIEIAHCCFKHETQITQQQSRVSF